MTYRRSGPGARPGDALIALVESLLANSDPPNLAGWAALLAPDAHLRLGNRPVVVGRAACLCELRALFERTQALGRGFRELWPSINGETVLMEVDLVASVKAASLPAAVIIRTISPNTLVWDIRFHLDPSPLGPFTTWDVWQDPVGLE